MKENFLGEIAISAVLIGILAFFLEPLNLMMPDIMHPVMVPVLAIVFVILAASLWKENRGDERVEYHKFISSRFAYFAAVATLVVAIIFQTLRSELDPWLVVTVCILLLAKIAGIIYANIKH